MRVALQTAFTQKPAGKFWWIQKDTPGGQRIQHGKGPSFRSLQKRNVFKRDLKVDPLGIKVVPPGGSVFCLYTCEVLKACRPLRAIVSIRVQPASATILNWRGPHSCLDFFLFSQVHKIDSSFRRFSRCPRSNRP